MAQSVDLLLANLTASNLAITCRSQWEIGFDWMAGQDIRGSTVGIVGLGGIGQSIVKRLIPFGVSKFLYTGRSEKKEGYFWLLLSSTTSYSFITLPPLSLCCVSLSTQKSLTKYTTVQIKI